MRLARHGYCDRRPRAVRTCRRDRRGAVAALSFLVLALCGSATAQTNINEPRRSNAAMIDLVGVPLAPIDGAARSHKAAPPPQESAPKMPRPEPRRIYPLPPVAMPQGSSPAAAPGANTAAQPARVHVPLPPTRPALDAVPIPTPALRTLPAPTIEEATRPAQPRAVAPSLKAAALPLPPISVPEQRVAPATPRLPPVAVVPPVPVAAIPQEAIEQDAEDDEARDFQLASGPRARVEDLSLPRAEPLRRKRMQAEAGGVDPITVGAISREQISLLVHAMPLDIALRELGKMAGYTINVSPGVQGTVRDRRIEGTMDVILDQLGQEFGLFWFNDGFTIHVDPIEDQKTRFVRVAGMTQREMDSRLREAGLSRFNKRIQLSTRDKLVRIIGSDAFLRTVEATLSVPVEEKTRIQVIRFGAQGR